MPNYNNKNNISNDACPGSTVGYNNPSLSPGNHKELVDFFDGNDSASSNFSFGLGLALPLTRVGTA